MFERKDDEKGDFNSGLAIIYRLDTIHKQLHIARANRDHQLMYSMLVSFFQEIVRGWSKKRIELKNNEEFKDHIKYWEQVKKDYFHINKLIAEKKPIPANLYDSFNWWEIQMTLVEESLDWGMPKKRDSRYALS